jgi:hypothetical protein
MKKIGLCVFASVAVIVIAVIIANVHFNSNKSNLSEISLINVEALASGEGGTPCGGPVDPCTNNCKKQNTVNCKDLAGCQ